jgi:hypothetical protein
MERSKIVCLIAIGLIVLLAFYRCPKKESFKMMYPGGQMVNTAAQFVPNNMYTPVAGLNGSGLRSGNPVAFADMVVSPTPTQVAKDNIVNQMSDPRDYLPVGMSNVYNEDAWNAQRATVRLQKSRWSQPTDALFNLGGGEIEPVNSIHKLTDHTVREINNIKFDIGSTPPSATQISVGAPPLDTTMLVGFPSSWNVPPSASR